MQRSGFFPLPCALLAPACMWPCTLREDLALTPLADACPHATPPTCIPTHPRPPVFPCNPPAHLPHHADAAANAFAQSFAPSFGLSGSGTQCLANAAADANAFSLGGAGGSTSAAGGGCAVAHVSQINP